jgi:hypothetical protein
MARIVIGGGNMIGGDDDVGATGGDEIPSSPSNQVSSPTSELQLK